MRIILYTGKGGVGKTTIAAATAIKIASEGRKVLVMSTDQAHSLGDSLDRELSDKPVRITGNLDAMEIDAVEESEKAYGRLKEYLKRLLISRSEDSLEAEELLVFPGFEELCSLLRVKEISEMGMYDVAIVDCAPTGETMSLLKFPEMLGWWMEHLFPIKRKAIKIAGPVVEKTLKIPMPDEKSMGQIERLYEKLAGLQGMMSDKTKVSIRIVTTPERIVVREAKRNFSYLHLYDYNVDAIIVNKIYPVESMQGYFGRWIENQETGLKEIQESFSMLPVFRMELKNQELRTVERLMEAGEQLYQEEDASRIFFCDTIFRLEKEQDGYVLIISLPFANKEELDLLHKGDELTLVLKNERRSFLLPDKLRTKDIIKAGYEEGLLKIYFN